jgi:transposase
MTLMRTHGSAIELEKVRMFAANMFEQGLPSVGIARSLNVDVQTVRRWRRIYNICGRPGLDSRKHPGSKPRLNPQQQERLAQLLLLTPTQCGFERYLWTTSLIADLIQREFNVSYHHDTVGFLLRDLGFSWQKPACRARERDGIRIEAWRREVWPEILKKVSLDPA